MLQDFHARVGQSHTHVLMDGGRLHVPPDRLNEFCDRYVQCIRENIKIFVVEQKTPYYKFFVDVDYVDDEGLTLENVSDLARVICDKVMSLVPQATQCIVSAAQPKPKGEGVKTGIHLNWPHVVVDQTRATRLREHLVSHLNKIYQAKQWQEIIDASVYGGSGFRLPWSHKMAKGVTEGPYVPLLEYTNGKMADISGHPVTPDLLRLVSIRTHGQEPNVEVPEPEVFSLTGKKGGHTSNLSGVDINNLQINAEVETFIRKHMRGQGDARVQKVLKNKKNYYVKTNSRFCENVLREHSSNHVWFLITEDGRICQKCFCTCDTTKGRLHGFCSKFSGREHCLFSNIKDLLYPEQKERRRNLNKR